jgi:hypothetical protein
MWGAPQGRRCISCGSQLGLALFKVDVHVRRSTGCNVSMETAARYDVGKPLPDLTRAALLNALRMEINEKVSAFRDPSGSMDDRTTTSTMKASSEISRVSKSQPGSRATRGSGYLTVSVSICNRFYETVPLPRIGVRNSTRRKRSFLCLQPRKMCH